MREDSELGKKLRVRYAKVFKRFGHPDPEARHKFSDKLVRLGDGTMGCDVCNLSK